MQGRAGGPCRAGVSDQTVIAGLHVRSAESMKHPTIALNHLQNAKMRSYCPKTFLKFQCSDDVSESKMLWD